MTDDGLGITPDSSGPLLLRRGDRRQDGGIVTFRAPLKFLLYRRGRRSSINFWRVDFSLSKTPFFLYNIILLYYYKKCKELLKKVTSTRF